MKYRVPSACSGNGLGRGKEQNCHAIVSINHQIKMYAITLRLSFILFGYLVIWSGSKDSMR